MKVHGIQRLTFFRLLLLLIWMAAQPVFPGWLPAQQKADRRFAASYLTSREGLAQNSAYDMLQDEFGFVWIATQTAITRYDGRSFTEFPFKELAGPVSDDSRYETFLCEHTVLCEDSVRDILWAGSCGKLYGISTNSHESWQVDLGGDKEILGLFVDEARRLILLSGEGLFALQWEDDFRKAVPTEYDYLQLTRPGPGSGNVLFRMGKQIRSLVQEREGGDWLLCTSGGAFLLRPDAHGTRRAVARIGDETGDLTGVSVAAFRWEQPPPGRSNEIWRAGGDSLIIYDTTGRRLAAIAARAVNFIAPLRLTDDPREDKMMLGTEFDGLRVVGPDYRMEEADHGSSFNWPGMIRGNQVRSSLVTRDGAIWIGTRGMGITRLVDRKQSFEHHFQPFQFPGTIPNNYVWAIWRENEQSQEVWLGTENNGLCRYDLEKREPVEFFDVWPSTEDNIVKAIVPAGDTLWLGGKCRVAYLIRSQENRKVRWVRDRSLDPWPLSSHYVTALWYEKGMRRLWVGGSTGKLKVLENNRYHEIGMPGNQLITYIGPGVGDSVMVATDHGFVQFPLGKPQGQFTHGPVYLADEHLKCVIPGMDSVFAWAGTVGNGLVRLRKRADGGMERRNYLVRDGLPDPVVYGIIPSNRGSLWLSTNRGLSQFFPDRGIFINYSEEDGLQHPEFNTGAFFKVGDALHFGGVNGFNLFREAAQEPDPYLPQVALAYFIADTGGKDEKVILFDTPADSAPAIRLDYDYQYVELRVVGLHYQDFAKVNYKYRLYPAGETPPEWTLLRGAPEFTLSQDNGLGSGWFVPRRYVLEVWASDLLGGTGGDHASTPHGRTLRIAISVDPPYWQTWWFILAVLLVSTVILILAFNLYRQNARLRTRNTDLQTAYNNTASLADLNVIGQKIVASLKLEENFEAIMEEISDLSDLRSDVFAVDLLDENEPLLVSRLSIEDGQRLGNYAVSLDNPNSLGVACIKLAEAGGEHADGFLINDLSDRSQYPFLKGNPGVQEGRPTQATLFVPLRVGDRVLGAITVQSYAADVYRPYHLNMLQILGAYIAIAIDHARTTEALLKAERAHTRAEQEDLIKALDIKLLRSQLSPHFIFNSLGTIQYLVSEGDPRADDYTARLGEIMREVMTMITRSDISLKTEAEFLRDYIEAEKIRFRNEYEFRWRLETDPALDPAEVFIPPMLLQPFIENSLEHAFYPLPTEGPEIRVFFGRMKDRLVIVVEDNGIGLGQEKPRKREDHPRKNSTALQNIRRRAELINQLNQGQGTGMEIRALDLATASPDDLCRVETWNLSPFRRGARFELHLPFSFKFTATTLND